MFQSTQLVRIGNNSISCNRMSGVHVETGCRVELRGNGIYDNRSHGIISKGDGTIIENDIIGNRECGLQLIQTADMKVQSLGSASLLSSSKILYAIYVITVVKVLQYAQTKRLPGQNTPCKMYVFFSMLSAFF